MEYPGSWDLLTASLNGGRLEQPSLAWAFLTLQGLVRDAPSDKETFLGLVEQHSEPITGPSSGRRVAGELGRLGLALPPAEQPDPFGEIAAQRWAATQNWQRWTPTQPAPESLGPAPIPFVYCISCGARAETTPPANTCPQCQTVWPDMATTRVKPCLNCRIGNFLAAVFCESCGVKLPEEESAPAPPPDLPRMFTERYFQLYGQPQTIAEAAAYAGHLRHVLWNTAQDLAVIKSLLQEKGVWDDGRYRALRVERMIADQGGPGATPWQNYSQYPYTLDETEFLRQQFDAGDEEIAAFEAAVKDTQTQT